MASFLRVAIFVFALLFMRDIVRGDADETLVCEICYGDWDTPIYYNDRVNDLLQDTADNISSCPYCGYFNEQRSLLVDTRYSRRACDG